MVIIDDLLVKELVDVADVMLAAMVAALWALAPDIVTVDEDISSQIGGAMRQTCRCSYK